MTTKPSLVTVEAADAGMRLDAYLARQFPAYSRNIFQRLIEEGGVLLNEKKTVKDAKVKSGDTVTVVFHEPEQVSLEPDSSVPFSVVFDSAEFAVIDKPAGVVVHPSDTHKKGTLVNGLLARWPQVRGVGEDPFRPGIVHRLDKETSGLMVIPKTQEMFRWLKKQFQDHAVQKHYTALVFGKIRKDEGVIEVPIGRMGMKQVAVVSGREDVFKKSRFARTGFKKIASYGDVTLIEAIPETGRMHQIRVHCKHIGHPLVGDKKYTPLRLLKSLPCQRQFLHASSLMFSLPDGSKQAFFSPLPEDLKEVLRGLAPDTNRR